MQDAEHIGHNRVADGNRGRMYKALKGRVAKAAKRNRRVANLAKTTLKTTCLYKTGTVATATFSTTSLGLSPELQMKLDKMAWAACQISGLSPCSTTTVWMALVYMPFVGTLLAFMRTLPIPCALLGFVPHNLTKMFGSNWMKNQSIMSIFALMLMTFVFFTIIPSS